MGLPPNHHPFIDGDFPRNRPTSYWIPPLQAIRRELVGDGIALEEAPLGGLTTGSFQPIWSVLHCWICVCSIPEVEKQWTMPKNGMIAPNFGSVVFELVDLQHINLYFWDFHAFLFNNLVPQARESADSPPCNSRHVFSSFSTLHAKDPVFLHVSSLEGI